MNHGSLFSGIGGFDLAAEWMGWNNVFHCENNPFGQKILNHYWPNSISYEDIKKTDFSIHRGTIDVLTGGFPCQPYSVAGLRKGKDDERHLWPEMLRAIREIKPRWIVGENVLGLASWNGGLVFEEVQTDLEAEGYEVQPYVLPAASVEAPHKRDRIWFVAYSSSIRRRKRIGKDVIYCGRCTCEYITQGGKIWDRNQTISGTGISSIASSKRCDNGIDNRQERSIQANERLTSKNKSERKRRKCRSCSVSSITPNTTNSRFKSLRESEECIYELESSTNTQSQQSKQLQSEFRETFEKEQRKPRRSDCPNSCSDRSSDTYFDGDAVKICRCGHGDFRFITNSSSFGLWRQSNRARKSGFFNQKSKGDHWENFPTQSPVCDGDDGLSSRLDGITFPKWRNESIKAGGNAIVPQVVYQIFKAIEMYEP